MRDITGIFGFTYIMHHAADMGRFWDVGYRRKQS